MRDLAEIILNITNSKSKLISLQELDPDDNTVLKLSNEKAKKILKWYPQFDIKAGIMDMLNKNML
jgi:nucleoside-diphosphate-sugar epimerase